MQVTLLVLSVSIKYRLILLTILFITSCCKPLKKDLHRQICTYATWQASFCQINTLINLNIPATALLENSQYYEVSLENKRLSFNLLFGYPKAKFDLDMINKKSMRLKLHYCTQLSYKRQSCFQTLLIVNYHVNLTLTQTNNISPCSNEKLNM